MDVHNNMCVVDTVSFSNAICVQRTTTVYVLAVLQPHVS